MDISYKKIIALVFLIPILGSTCKKGAVCGDNNSYSFKANYVKVLPDLDSIHVGDTIWIEFNLPTLFTDTVINQAIDYSNTNSFGNYISELKFTGGSVSDPGSEYASQSFKYILITGSPAKNNSSTEGQAYNFLEENNFYVLKVGLITESPGTFAFSISDAAGVVRKSDPCTKASFAFGFTNTDQHLYLYQKNRPGYAISGYEAAHLYCFKVN